MMNVLITDLNIYLDGHKYGFINNLIKYIETKNDSNKYFILSNASKEFKFESSAKNIRISSVSESDQSVIKAQKHFFQKSAVEWKIIKHFCLENSINHLILMELDLYQIEIGKAQSPFTISGIWFRPYSRMQQIGDGLKAKVAFHRTLLQKKLTMKFALRNRNLKKVFILNDESMPLWLNKKIERFFCLPDPYFEYPVLPDFDLRKKHNIPANNLILLQFGSMDERKNNENIVAALNHLEENISLKITLLLIGKFRDGYYDKALKLKNPDAKFQYILKDEFVSDAEMESTFAQSDLILRMNVNFFGSSGIVGQAAFHNKPCLVSNNGVMAELVEKYKLGVTLDPFDVNAIQKTLKNFVENPEEFKINGEPYMQTHNLEAYASTLLDLN